MEKAMEKRRNDDSIDNNSIDNNIKKVEVFAMASLLNDLGSDAVKPFWPTFVTSVIGAPTYILGILDGFGEALSYGIRWPAGYLSDKYKTRKPFVWIGYFLSGLSRIGYAISKSVIPLFPFKAMDRMGKLRDPPRDAMLAEIVEKKKRGKAFGILNAADNFGAMLAPLFGLLLFTLLSYRLTFALAAIPSFISTIIIFFLVKEKKPKARKRKKFHFTKDFKKLILSASFFALGWLSVSFMILFATNMKGLPILFSPIFLFVVAIFSIISSYFYGKLSDQLGRKKTLILAYFTYFLTLTAFFSYCFVETSSFSLFILLVFFALYGLSFGSVTTLQSAFVSDIIPAENRAQAIGIFSVVFGFSALFASAIAGFLWDFVSPTATFGFALLMVAIGTSLLFLLGKNKS